MLHPGRAADVVATDASGDIVIRGLAGELHPRLAEAWDLRLGRVILAELSIRGLSGGQLPVARVAAPSRFQDVERDVAVVVPEDRPSAQLEAAIREAGGPLLADVRLFDVYRGAPLADAQRSLAFRVRFAAEDRTLTEAEIDTAMASIMTALQAAGGRIRS
jgi:phenylalanyl-tRNA synthetase beta chain